MQEVTSKTTEKAVLIAVKTKDETRGRVEEHLDELGKLASTAGAEAFEKIVQDRSKIDTAFYIGKGKAEELAQFVEMNEIDLIIFDDDLSPDQVRNLEQLTNRKVMDRSGLILDIFASHAKTKQAKTQVELAQLEYTLPRLTRAWTHLSKQAGGIGTRGPGETQIETDRRIIRTRIGKLKKTLEKIELQQETKSAKRGDYLTAALVGYTNAGKSTLINNLTDAGVLVENQLFATLDSTTRSIDLGKNQPVLISDTVGFIRKLPHNLIASFMSTLNVVKDADIILHVIDLSSPAFEEHMQVVRETLKELECDKKPQIRVFNKVDSLEDKNRIEYVRNKYEHSIVVSAHRSININQLLEKLKEAYEANYTEELVELDIADSKTISQVHSLAEVLSKKYNDNTVFIKYRADSAVSEKIKSMVGKRTGTDN